MTKKLLSRLALFVVLLLFAALILPTAAACKNNNTDNNGGGSGTGNYSVKIASMGDIGLSGVTVELYDGNKKVSTNTTDKNGFIRFSENKEYTVAVSKLPKGYYVPAGSSMKLNGKQNSYTFKLPARIIGETAPTNLSYKIGSIMYDFSVVTPDKTVVTLSKLFETKKAVLINFWGSLCSNCADEFPVMQKIYENYKNDIAIIALDPPSAYGDSDEDVTEWKNRYELTFDMAMDTAGVADRFGVNAYPTSVMIDRYATVCEIEVGAITSEQEWTNLFKEYTADNYEQHITVGSDNDTEFVPDKPADFGESMPASAEIEQAINKNGISATYYGESGDEFSWPWILMDGCLVPGNTNYNQPAYVNHRYTYAIIYIEVDFTAGKMLAFDYQCSTEEDGDIFHVMVDVDTGISREVWTDSGVHEGFKTGYVYAPLEEGKHTIGLVYYKDFYDDGGDDIVRIKNMRLIDASEVAEPVDRPYYAARNLNEMTGQYDIYEDVYYSEADGFYRVKNRESAGEDPILFADFHNRTPYAKSGSIYDTYIAGNKCVFDGYDYYNEMVAYNNVAGNSEISGLVPVTEQLKDILDAIARQERGGEIGLYNDKLWLGFCSFFQHYGEGDAISNPIEGIAYYSAFTAKLFTEGNADTVNVAKFGRLLMPRGFVYEFTPTQSGVYSFRSTLEKGAKGEDGDLLEGEAQLITESEMIKAGHHATAKALDSCDSDQFIRTGEDEQNFHMYDYLEANKTYYLVVRFVSPSSLGELPFLIEYCGPTKTVLTTATSGYFVADLETGVNSLIYYCTPEKRADGFYYDKKTGGEIFLDFKYTSRVFGQRSLEKMLTGYYYSEVRIDEGGNKSYYTRYSDKELEENLNEPTVTAPKLTRIYPFNLSNTAEIIVDEKTNQNLADLVGVEAKDYTADMLAYLEKAKQNDGLVQVDELLKNILVLFYAKQTHITPNEWKNNPDEWLMTCYFNRVIDGVGK